MPSGTRRSSDSRRSWNELTGFGAVTPTAETAIRILGRRMILLALLPALCFPALYALCRPTPERSDWRETLLLAAVVWGAALVALTEGLSMLRAVTPLGLAASWGVTLAVLSAVAVRQAARREIPAVAVVVGHEPYKPADWLLLVGLIACLAPLLVTVLVGPTNTMDTMTYHLPRVVHWAQNQAIEHYPTHDSRQLYHPPFVELVDLNLFVLTGGDRLGGLARWCFLVGTLVGVSRVAAQLGGGARAQLVAAIAAVTLPGELLLTAGGKNGPVAAFFLVVLVSGLLSLRERIDARGVATAGLALGLALLTKTTAYLFAAPFLLAFGLELLWRRRARAVVPCVCIGLVAALLNAGHYRRNLALYGSPVTDPARRAALSVEAPTLGSTTSNALRNVSLHLGTGSTTANAWVEGAVVGVHRVFGLDPDDRATTAYRKPFLVRPSFRIGPDSGNHLHFLALAGCLFALVSARGLRRDGTLVAYALAGLAGFVLFCTGVKWSIGLGRLHLPLFVLATPFLGVVLVRSLGRGRAALVALLCLLGAAPYLGLNTALPLLRWHSIFRIPREELYFRATDQLLHAQAREVLALLQARGVRDVGLLPLHRVHPEYPLWAVLQDQLEGLRCEHVGVPPPSGELPYGTPSGGFEPDAILAIGAGSWRRQPDIYAESVTSNGVRYEKLQEWPRLALYVPRTAEE